jgi:hypothetical protein
MIEQDDPEEFLGCSMNNLLFRTVLMAAFFSFASQASGDLVAHYPMNEGIGLTVFDASGHGNHGTIYNGSWTFGPFGTALHFDGYGDGHINCGHQGSLNIEKGGSVLVWFKPEGPMQGGLVCWGLGGSWAEQRFTTLLNTYGNYDELGVYLADGTDYFRPYREALPPLDEWTCLAVTFTGRSIDIYVDGVLEETAFQQIEPGIADYDLLIGKAYGWAQTGLFRGVIDEVRIYNNSLSPGEVFELYKAEAGSRGKDTSGFDTVRITPQVCPRPGTIVADLDYRGLAPEPQNMTLKADLIKGTPSSGSVTGSSSKGIRHEALASGAQQGSAGEAAPATVRMLPVWGAARAVFDGGGLPKGAYKIRVRAFDGMKPIGKTALSPVFWPGRDPAWEGVTVLNNMCWELLNESPGTDPDPEYEFFNPRRGWVYFITEAAGNFTLSVDGANPQVIHNPVGPGRQEAMRWLEEGSVSVLVTGTGSLDKLIVRAVPALVFGHWPNVKTGLINKEDHDFWVEHILPQVNTIMDHGNRWYTDAWVNQEGGRWRQIVYKPLAEVSGTTQGIYGYLTSLDGLTHPDVHALQLDEFYPGVSYVEEWTEACSAILQDPQFDGHMIIPYFSGKMWDDADCTAFLQTVTGAGSWIAKEAYFPEMETEDRAWVSVNRELSKTLDSLEQVIPGVTDQVQVVLSILTEFAGENADVQADFKVFKEMQFHQLATEPRFFGIPAIEEYVSHHSDEETIRWAARLYRHYALEGNRERLSADPYTLSHIQNGDFLNGTHGWTIEEAEPGTVDVKSFRGLGILQHRRSYGYKTVVPFLWTRRSAVQSNRYFQTIKGLEPGRLYSVKLITGDYHDLILGQSAEKVHALSIEIQGADPLTGPQFRFQHTGKSTGTVGAFNTEHPYWMNQHCQVFRALSVEAGVTVSDWMTPSTPGGPIGQELIHSHIEVQPYFEDAP